DLRAHCRVLTRTVWNQPVRSRAPDHRTDDRTGNVVSDVLSVVPCGFTDYEVYRFKAVATGPLLAPVPSRASSAEGNRDDHRREELPGPGRSPASRLRQPRDGGPAAVSPLRPRLQGRRRPQRA